MAMQISFYQKCMTFSVICLSAMSVADELTLMTLAKTAATTVSTIIEWKMTIATPVDVKRQKHSGLLDQKTAFSHILKTFMKDLKINLQSHPPSLSNAVLA